MLHAISMCGRMDVFCVLVMVCLLHQTGHSVASPVGAVRSKSSRVERSDQCSDVPLNERQVCGRPGWTEDQCASLGCCWALIAGHLGPSCFLPRSSLEESCNVSSATKADCGHSEISAEECHLRGCCWHPNAGNNDPWCFHGRLYLPTVAPGTIRLVEGQTDNAGRIEIFHKGEWGSVCRDWFDNLAAAVVCRSLGHGYGYGFKGFHSAGTGRIWLDNVQCTGQERRVEDCEHERWGINNCDHAEDAGVECVDAAPTDGTLRLVSGYRSAQGRLEIWYNDSWGTVCESGFGMAEAQVACRQLGYPADTEVTIGMKTARIGSGQIALDNVRCIGSETSLGDCGHAGWVGHNCSHMNDVGVDCGDFEGALRLQGGGYDRGRLAILHEGIWGTVCDDGFGMAAARVACRQLGLPGNRITMHMADGYSGSDWQTWLDEVRCTGSESSLSDCEHAPWGVHNCEHLEDVYLDCDFQ